MTQTVVSQGQTKPIERPVAPRFVVRPGETLQRFVEIAGAQLRQSQGMEVPGRLIAGNSLLRPLDDLREIDRALASHGARSYQDKGFEVILRLRHVLEHVPAEAFVA